MIFVPSKLFPCDCMGEGLTVTPLDDEDISENEVFMSEDKKLRDCKGSPYIQLSFWEYGVCKKPRYNWWWRLKVAYHVFRDGSPWPDMVTMTAAHAKNFANHILYTISKAEKEMKPEKLIVEAEPTSGEVDGAEISQEPCPHGNTSQCLICDSIQPML